MDAFYYNANFTDILKNKMAPKSHLFDVSSPWGYDPDSTCFLSSLPLLFPLPRGGRVIWAYISLKGSDVTQIMVHIRRYIPGTAYGRGKAVVSFIYVAVHVDWTTQSSIPSIGWRTG